MTFNPTLIALVLAFSFKAALTAEAQTTTGRTVVAAPGKPVRLGVHGALKADCTAGPLPEIRIIQTPKNGVLVVRHGKAKMNRAGRCPAGTEFPAQIAIYQARPDFIGGDSVTYEVKGANETNTFTIDLKVRRNAQPSKSDGATEL